MRPLELSANPREDSSSYHPAAGEEEPQPVAAPAGGEPRGDGRHHGHGRGRLRQAQTERGRGRGRAGEEGGRGRDQHAARHGQR